MTDRIVCLFSCGAASAVATKLAIANANGVPLVIMNNEVVEEHTDNKRFLNDCQAWFGRPVETVTNAKYHGSIYEVFQQKKYIKNRFGAPCTQHLKKEMFTPAAGDRVVLGYTAEEQHRLDRFIDANNDVDAWAPLIDAGITKSDCLAMVQRAGIELPEMYKLGYHNNNCIGCVKGGMGYWNKIRNDFPLTFQRMADLEARLGPGSYLFRDRNTGERIPLTALDANAGDYPSEPDIQCGLFCEMAEREIAA
jgi:hypothetical protein